MTSKNSRGVKPELPGSNPERSAAMMEGAAVQRRIDVGEDAKLVRARAPFKEIVYEVVSRDGKGSLVLRDHNLGRVAWSESNLQPVGDPRPGDRVRHKVFDKVATVQSVSDKETFDGRRFLTCSLGTFCLDNVEVVAALCGATSRVARDPLPCILERGHSSFHHDASGANWGRSDGGGNFVPDHVEVSGGASIVVGTGGPFSITGGTASRDALRAHNEGVKVHWDEMCKAAARASLFEVEARALAVSGELDLEREHVLRLKLKLAERPDPRPPASLLERASARAGCEVTWAARTARDAVLTVACLPVRTARAVGRRASAAARWTWPRVRRDAVQTLEKDNLCTVGATLILGILVWCIVMLAIWTPSVSAEREALAIVVPAPPNPDDIRERAWIEARAARAAKTWR